MNRTRYRYLGCADGVMRWESVTPIPGDSRHEQIACRWDYFWAAR